VNPVWFSTTKCPSYYVGMFGFQKALKCVRSHLMLDVRWLMCADRRLLPNVVILLAPLSVFHRSSTWRKAKDERLVTRDNNAASHMTRLTLFSPYRFLIEKYLRWLDSCTTWPNAWKQLSNYNWYICFCFFFFFVCFAVWQWGSRRGAAGLGNGQGLCRQQCAQGQVRCKHLPGQLPAAHWIPQEE